MGYQATLPKMGTECLLVATTTTNTLQYNTLQGGMSNDVVLITFYGICLLFRLSCLQLGEKGLDSLSFDDVRFPAWDDSPTNKTKSTSKNLNSSKELTKLLEEEIVLNIKALDPLNKAAIQSAFARWLKSGTTPDTIREMIRIFTTDTTFQRGNGPYWKRFLWHRDTLLQRAEAITTPTNWLDFGE